MNPTPSCNVRRAHRWIALAALAPATGLAQVSAVGPTGTIVGVVTDSIAGRPLAGATVRVDGVAPTTITDSLGHYRFDAVPAGMHRVVVRHAALDSLQLAIRSVGFALPPNGTVAVPLATPSLPTVLGIFCPEAIPAALIFGHVAHADRDDAVPGATVTAGWMASSAEGRAATTDSTGRYHLCVAPDRAIMLKARLETEAVSYEPPPAKGAVLFANLSLPVPGARADATLSGQVVNETGRPVSGASVTLLETPGVNATTGDDGRFRLTDLPVGTRVLIVRSVGLDASIMSIDLSARAPRTVMVSMHPAPPTLPTVKVTAERAQLTEAYQRVGFTERQHIGIGRFITQDQIQNHGALTTADVLTNVKGITVGDNGDHGVDADAIDSRISPYSGSHPCTLYVVDNQVLGQDDYARGLPPPSQVIGIEVYRAGQPVPIPPPPGAEPCAEVLVWTRAMLPPRSEH
jgi:hypothetical protein